jgi:palmitoyltransferase ZDHHC9/14/18
LLPIATRPPLPISGGPQSPRARRGVRTSLERVFGRPSIDSSVRPSTSPSYEHYKPPPSSSRRSPLGGSSPEPPLFLPTPPAGLPLRAQPIPNPRTGAPLRNYQRHPSRNKFFLRGRLLTGGDSPWAFLASLALVAAITGTWFGTTCVWWWRHKSPAVALVGAYMCLLTVSTMLATAMRDPGILPRALDPDPPYPAASPSDGAPRVPMPRDLKVRTDVVRVKYCPTCRTYRPPRASHCKMCDNCVDACDHHCQWVNNCVGRRNYTVFFVFLVAAVLTLVLVATTAALHIYFLARGGAGFRKALGRAAGSAVVFCLAIAVIWPVAVLLSYHMRLLLLNITTIEQIRNNAHKALVPGPPPPNPFSHGSMRRNVLAVLCRPEGYSWLDASAVAVEDRRLVNPALGRRSEEGLDM